MWDEIEKHDCYDTLKADSEPEVLRNAQAGTAHLRLGEPDNQKHEGDYHAWIISRTFQSDVPDASNIRR